MGISHEVNDSITGLMSNKTITSATLMANGPAIDEASKMTPLFPECSFGVHLNLTSFTPITSSNQLQALLDDDGMFSGLRNLLSTALTDELLGAIFEELSAQIQKIISYGINISHFDSHEHIHTIPRMFPVIKKLQKKYGVRKVRISRNIYLNNQPKSLTLVIKKRLFNFLLKHFIATRTTSGFCNLIQFHENIKAKKLEHKSIEIMVHPGTEEFKQEINILDSLIRGNFATNIKLISYNQL